MTTVGIVCARKMNRRAEDTDPQRRLSEASEPDATFGMVNPVGTRRRGSSTKTRPTLIGDAMMDNPMSQGAMSRRSSNVKTRPMLIDRTSATLAMQVQFDSINIDTTDLTIDRLDVIGEGAFGEVYGGTLRSEAGDLIVAVKLVKPSLVAAHGIKKMYPAFIKEVTLMKKACDASQNGVCRLYGAVAVDGTLGIVMKRYDHSLQDEINSELPGTIELDRTINIAWTIARAASFIHGLKPPMLLRDIKPDNILIDSDGEPVIADFGCAGQVGMGEMQSSGQSGLSVVSSNLIGTTRFMAPEQVGWRYERGMKESGMAKVKRHADVWAFACTLSSMLSGKSPWGEFKDTQVQGTLRGWGAERDDVVFQELTSLPTDVPPRLVEILKKCLVVPPEARPTFAKLAQMLTQNSLTRAPTSMEGVSLAEAKDLLEVAKHAPRWLLRNGTTELGFVVDQRDEDDAKRIHVLDTPRVPGAQRIKAAKLDTVLVEGTLYKVFAVKRTGSGDAMYTIEWLQHWQVPSPCDQSLLGWSAEYRDVAMALSSGAADDGEERLREASRREIVDPDLITLAHDHTTFNDIKTLIVVPLLEQEKKQKATHSLAYSSLLGDASDVSSADPDTRGGVFDGKGLHSRRASIFFSWSFTQLFGDFVDAFGAFLEETLEDEGSRMCVHAWISPLSLSQDPMELEKLQTEDWAERFEELVRTIGRDGLGTVLLWTPSDNPEPIKRMWCIWEMFIAKKTNSRLTVQAPKRVDLSTATPIVKSEDAKDRDGAALALVQRVLETQVLSGAGTELSYRGINTFVLDSFREAVQRRHWQQAHDPTSGAPYWHNVVTDETSWAFMGGDRSSEREAAVSIVTGAARASV